jgi:Ser/Thr protein kinase RdoA (MazF antagonist)
MGVKTSITLQEVQKLFPSHTFKTLTPTKNGVIDTTYILDEFILKRYERDIDTKVQEDTKRLQFLRKSGLNVPLCLAQNNSWFLYEKLKGEVPKHIRLKHIQVLARFMAKMHRVNYKNYAKESFLEQYDLDASLYTLQKSFYFYYKKLASLAHYTQKNDGFIHGDIFKDNTLFYKDKIAVFDFIDGGNGSFVFDIAVALVAFNPHKRQSFTRAFLNTYNQRSPYKIELKELQKEISSSAKLYSLLRLTSQRNSKRAKKLANLW